MASLFEFKDDKIIYTCDGNTYICTLEDKIYYNLVKLAASDITNVIFNDQDNKYYDDKKIKFKINIDNEISKLEYTFYYQIKEELFMKGMHEFKKLVIPLNKIPYEFEDYFYTKYTDVRNHVGIFIHHSVKYNIKILLNKDILDIYVNGKIRSYLSKKGDFNLFKNDDIYKLTIIHNGDSIIVIYPVIPAELTDQKIK